MDGQQRVTSLILLLSVLVRESEDEHKEVVSNFIQEGRAGNTHRKLILGQGQDHTFKSLVEKGATTAVETSTNSKSDQNLKNAVEEFQSWLKSQNIDDVLRCVRADLGFLFYAPENSKEIGIMFEVINNRGKALSELEKIKNYLIYYADKNDMRDIREAVNDSWPIILSNLNKIDYTSNENEDRFLRNCWIVFMDTHKSRSHNVYDSLKQKWPPDGQHISENVKKILEFIEFLKHAAIYYVRYLKREGVTDPTEKSWLERISCHPADASITPLILSVSGKEIEQNDRNDLFELLEKLNFRYYGTRIAGRSDSGQGELFVYANKFFNNFGEEEEGKTIDIQWLKEQLIKFVDENANDKSFVEHLTLDKDEAGEYYSWVGLKFFLASYEENLQEMQGKSTNLQKFFASRNPDAPNDFYHREHIWAKGDDTKKIESKDNLDVNKRRLGNFLLLNEGLNIKVSNEPPEEKMNLYFGIDENTPNTLMIQELKKFFDNAEEVVSKYRKRKTKGYWHDVYKRFLDKREEKMVNFALKRWSVSGLNSKKISEVSLDSLGTQNEIYTIKHS